MITKLRNLSTAGAATLWLMPPPAMGAAHKLDCAHQAGRLHQACALVEAELAADPGIDATYDLTYTFHCSGHATGIAISTKDGNSARLAMGQGQEQKLTVEGRGALVLKDQAPRATFDATLIGPCLIDIRAISILPSSHQLTSWKREAEGLTDSLNDGIDLLTLATDIVDINNFLSSRSRTLIDSLRIYLDSALLSAGVASGLRRFTDESGARILSLTEMNAEQAAEWEDLASSKPEIMNYYVTIITAQTLKDRAEPSFSEGQIAAATTLSRQALIKNYTENLKTRIGKANSFLQTIEPWRKNADLALRAAEAELVAATRGATAAGQEAEKEVAP